MLKYTKQQQLISTSSSSASSPPPPSTKSASESDGPLLMLDDNENPNSNTDDTDEAECDIENFNNCSIDRESSGTNNDTNGADDGSGSSSLAADDENHSFESGEESRTDFDDSHWDGFMIDNLTTSDQLDEKIYEDLCYVTFSKELPEVYIPHLNVCCCRLF